MAITRDRPAVIDQISVEYRDFSYLMLLHSTAALFKKNSFE